jgi:hypothetical protein
MKIAILSKIKSPINKRFEAYIKFIVTLKKNYHKIFFSLIFGPYLSHED